MLLIDLVASTVIALIYLVKFNRISLAFPLPIAIWLIVYNETT